MLRLQIFATITFAFMPVHLLDYLDMYLWNNKFFTSWLSGTLTLNYSENYFLIIQTKGSFIYLVIWRGGGHPFYHSYHEGLIQGLINPSIIYRYVINNWSASSDRSIYQNSLSSICSSSFISWKNIKCWPTDQQRDQQTSLLLQLLWS